MTIRLKILDAALERLNTDRPGDVPEVNERVSFPGERVEEPRMAVFLDADNLDEPRHAHDPLGRHRLLLGVQCVGVTDDAQELSRAAEPMLAWAQQCLGMGNLGGLVHWTRLVNIGMEREYLDLYIMRATAVFEVSYQALRADPYRST